MRNGGRISILGVINGAKAERPKPVVDTPIGVHRQPSVLEVAVANSNEHVAAQHTIDLLSK